MFLFSVQCSMCQYSNFMVRLSNCHPHLFLNASVFLYCLTVVRADMYGKGVVWCVEVRGCVGARAYLC